MIENQGNQNSLPIKHNLALIYISSVLIAVLMAFASTIGLLYCTTIYPTEELLRTFASNDVVNLIIGLPILLGSMWLAARGKLIGLLCWPGALFLVFYNYTAYVFAMPFNGLFPLHLTLAMLTVYTLIGLVAGIDGNIVHQRLSGAVPEKISRRCFGRIWPFVLIAGDWRPCHGSLSWDFGCRNRTGGQRLGFLCLARIVDWRHPSLASQGIGVCDRPWITFSSQHVIHFIDRLFTPAAIPDGCAIRGRRCDSGLCDGADLLYPICSLCIQGGGNVRFAPAEA